MEYEAQYKNEQEKHQKSHGVQQNIQNHKIKLLIIYIVVLMVYIYAGTPIFNPIYKDSYLFLSLNIFIILLIIFGNKLTSNKKIKRSFQVFGSILVLVFLLLSIASSPIFNSKQYYNLVGEVKEVKYSDAKSKLNTDLIPVVDNELAMKLGDKVLGEDIGLGSQYDIGEYYLISTPDDLAWVAPLEPQNFFKWLQNKSGSPGYIYVSATNSNDVRLVKEINGEPLKLKYTDNSFFNNNINRYAYLHNNFTKGLTDYSFEIDDEGNPYWVITTYAPKVGFSGYDVSGAIVVDAQTGEINNYKIGDKNIPEWIDRIYPKKFVESQLKYYGAYKSGWLNTITTQKGMIQPTGGVSYMFIDGKPYYYTGMSSVQSDESTVGFVLHSTTKKETTFVKVNGATETAARKSAQGKVQQYNYLASNPILLNIYDKPTYFMTLKDDDGLVKQYAFVSVENYNIVGIGSNLNDAKKDYYDQLKENNTLSQDALDEKEVEGTIDRINYLDDYYYFKLTDKEDIFMVDKQLSKDLILTESGDKAKIKYINYEDSGYKTVSEFTNESL